jgi:hypothetical protein
MSLWDVICFTPRYQQRWGGVCEALFLSADGSVDRCVDLYHFVTNATTNIVLPLTPQTPRHVFSLKYRGAQKPLAVYSSHHHVLAM